MITMRHNHLTLNENEVSVETREDLLKTTASVLSTLLFVCGKFHCFLIKSLGQTGGLTGNMYILFFFILYAQKDTELM